VSKTAICGMFHNISLQANIHSILAGLCNGAISEYLFITSKLFFVIIVVLEKLSHPCTTLCPIASISLIFFIVAFFHIVRNHKTSFIASS
jgi:hypothetical protein